MKMIIPTMAATIAHIRTEPAAISFTSPAIGLRSGDTRLTNLSIAVLNPSAASTTPKQSMIAIHSFRVMPKQNPATVTIIIAVQCIQALCSLLTKLRIPFQAYPKLRILFLLLQLLDQRFQTSGITYHNGQCTREKSVVRIDTDRT